MADDDEDWFESALQEAESTDGSAEDEAEDDSGVGEAGDASGDGLDGEPTPDEAADGAATGDPDETDVFDFDDADDETAGPFDDSPGQVGGDEAPDPFADVDGAEEFGEDEAPDPFGDDDGDDLFDEDFASAFGGGGAAGGGAAGGGGFGFDLDEGAGGGGGFDTGEFDDEEFESDIPRIELGIEGLDEMVQGGVPERSLMVVIGSAGTGKTTFGLQFLQCALADGESAVFITLEETRERIISTAVEKGWDFQEYVDTGQLVVLDLDPIEMANSLTSIRSELPALVEEFGASRLVLDSVSLLEMMYDDQATRRSEVYDFTKSLKAAGVTTMLTSEASEETPFASRYGIIEYLTDAVLVLRYVRPEDFRETRLAVEIQKIRDANHSRETKPYEITNDGISVYRQANIF